MKRGQRGFTLIELLIVVAIIGVLAAVVIPNVGRFLGRGEEEARRTEYHNVASAVIAMMVDNALASIPTAIEYTGAADEAVNDMTAFPDVDTSSATRVAFATGAGGTEVVGYRLYGNQIIVDVDNNGSYDAGDGVKLVNYVSMNKTKYYYTCEKDGTIRQWKTADTTVLTGTEYKY